MVVVCYALIAERFDDVAFLDLSIRSWTLRRHPYNDGALRIAKRISLSVVRGDRSRGDSEVGRPRLRIELRPGSNRRLFHLLPCFHYVAGCSVLGCRALPLGIHIFENTIDDKGRMWTPP